jgi:hypothetical protein
MVGGSALVLLTIVGVGVARLQGDDPRQPGRTEVVLRPTWDTYVNEAKPDVSYDGALQLRADGTPSVIRSYLRFDVPNVNGRLVGVRLRLFANAADRNGIVVAKTSGVATADPITWQTAPPVGELIGKGEPVEANQWVEINVATLNPRRGPVELVLLSAAKQWPITPASRAGRTLHPD